MKQNINFELTSKIKILKELKHLNDSKGFIEYSHNVEDIYKNTEEYNQNKKHRILIIFDDRLLICLVIKDLIQ